MFTAIQTLRSKRNSWFKRHEREIKKEEDKSNRDTMEIATPIIATRHTMSLESISAIKKIKVEEGLDVTVYENPRSCNGIIKSWCLTSKPVNGNSCLGMFLYCFPTWTSLIKQLLPINAEWKIQISMHVSVVSKVNNVSEFLILGKKQNFKDSCEFTTFYMQTFEFFEKAIVSHTNCYYFITFVKFSVVV